MNCQDCKQPLSEKRKAVKPTPRYCLECQAFYDARQTIDFSAPAFAELSEPDDIRKEGQINA